MVLLTRRRTLALLGITTLSWGLGSRPVAAEPASGSYELPPLPYDYDALEPYIDGETMRFHHDKHHAGYVKKLNRALSEYRQWQNLAIEDLMAKISYLPSSIRQTVRNNGGGHANHSLFWQSMSPQGGGEPSQELGGAIAETFSSFQDFQGQFNGAGLGQFGSGWVWLVVTPAKQLAILTTPNQDSPLMDGAIPLLGNDLWEHAYYLTYRNRRDDYLQAWWNVVNWPIVEERYRRAIA
ncbi:superoxide dismutase [Candidatus Synechococcus calcipolaris G9]|uniref:Superoxide dismutase n=1 Tax=Candidatus Synechococcus calcipolaris G9 TaxID=1497997 RepID=A0ABT6EWS9_9SYNE|nr:superoxide dismutase [Candidatus Synechococcus calcipolaris]MDG2990221.1 superoxide dismutase [Candidatus Synechococcus calcipolaris G9]